MARNGIAGQQVDPLAVRARPAVPPGALAPAVRGARPESEVHYPEGDGRYLSQNARHLMVVLRLLDGIRHHLDVDRDTILSDVPLFYVEGDSSKSVAPDVYVTRNHRFGDKTIYKVWKEGGPPDLVLETVSPSNTRKELEENKRDLYARIGIREYFLFDPQPKKDRTPLARFQMDRRKGMYRRTNSHGRPLRSEVLHTTLQPVGRVLAVMDPKTGEPYGRMKEIVDRAEKQTARAEARAEQAEKQTARAEARAEQAEKQTARAEARADRAEIEAEERRLESERLRQQLAELSRMRPFGPRR